MYKILEKTQFSEKVFKFRVEAPQMAKKAQAGQFLIVRIDETGERVPFTFAGWNPDEGWIEFIFMVIGKTTMHALHPRAW
jgi:ferredoxin--NADP+ reductase